ncbi:MAG TPA: hypothetical protein PLQ12_09790, partial [Candidatus Defluviicoccus seviourii]|nr:hypothetical protein [Candidatus Defluviicoccus seviourii]
PAGSVRRQQAAVAVALVADAPNRLALDRGQKAVRRHPPARPRNRTGATDLVRFRRIDAMQTDPFSSNLQRIAIDNQGLAGNVSLGSAKATESNQNDHGGEKGSF